MVSAALYLEHFASDRSHMLVEGLAPGGNTYSQAPPYECILSSRELPVSAFSGFTLHLYALSGAHTIRKDHAGVWRNACEASLCI